MKSQIGIKLSPRMLTMLQELYNIQKKAKPDEFMFNSVTAFRLCDLHRRGFVGARPCKEYTYASGYIVRFTNYINQFGIDYLVHTGFIAPEPKTRTKLT